MDETNNLSLPYIMPSQAQKFLTHNAALRDLDSLVQLAVIDRDLATPPGSPAAGDRYLVAASPTGAWAGNAGNIAAYQDGVWLFYAPQKGWCVWIEDEALLLAWTGSAWVLAGGQNINPASMIGVLATADATNRLSVKSDAALFANDDVTPGTGDMRLTISKAAGTNTASLLLEDGFSGRAEIGLAGDDNLHVKVSSDGTTWTDAVVVDPATGFTGFGSATPNNRIHVEGTSAITAGIKVRTNGVTNAALGGGILMHHNNAAGALPATGDRLGYALFGTTDGTTNRQGGGIEGRAEGDYSASSLATYFTFNTAPAGSVTRTERLRITAAGVTQPGADNAYSLGASGIRWSAVWAATGTIQTSDARDKRVVGDLHFAGAMIDALDPVLFKWNVGGNELASSTSETIEQDGEQVAKPVIVPRPGERAHAGFVAQDLKEAMDAAGVDFGAWGLEEKADPESRQWTRPDQLVAVLWAALKETRAELGAIKSRLSP